MESRPLYRVRDWDKHYENAQSRKAQRLTWVPAPNKHDGKSFRRIMAMPDGIAIYGAWCLIVQVASKCPTRGVLLDEDGALVAEDLSLKTGAPVEIFERALQVLSSERIGWLLVEQWENSTSALPDRSISAGLNGMEWNGMEGNGKELSTAPKTRTRFEPPTVAEVAAYCAERGNGVDAERFVAHYASKGWLVGKSPMKNWRMAVITWEKSGLNPTATSRVATPDELEHWNPTTGIE